MSSPRIPLVLVHGALGSGKTTLVKALLAHPRFAGALLIENEYADTGVDGELLSDGDRVPMIEITGSCICCSTGAELEGALEAVVRRGWDRPVLLEATGMAHAAKLLQKLFLTPRFLERFEILASVLLVDALEATAPLPPSLELEVQFADIVLLNKADLADPETLAQLESAVRAANPFADVRVTTRAALDPSLLGARPTLVETSLAAHASELRALDVRATTPYTVHRFDGPVDPAALRRALAPGGLGPDVALRRAKGFFQDPQGDAWLVEATGKHVELERLDRPRPPLLVVIGDGVTAEAVDRALA